MLTTQRQPLECAGGLPRVGMGYRRYLHDWMIENLSLFDVAEITVDHYLWANAGQRALMEDFAGRLPTVGHGVGLSIGTDVPLDLAYLDSVAEVLDKLGCRTYSEHVAFTKVPVAVPAGADSAAVNQGTWLDLANLIPIPKNQASLEALARKVEEVQRRVPVPFLLENITYLFDYPDSSMSDAAFFNQLCAATGAGMLLDLENLHINSTNHGFDARGAIDALDAGLVREVHMAGGGDYEVPGEETDAMLIDSHDRPLRDGATQLLEYLLAKQTPDMVLLERDGRLDQKYWPELLRDVDAIRTAVALA